MFADTGPWETGPMPTSSPRFLTLADVAEVLNVTVRQVYALVRSGDLRGIQIGGRGQWRIENDQLEDYISRQYARANSHDFDDEPVDEDVTSDH
ncbi:MAG: DNA-binding protein [Aeromicrobium sp.]|nr:DNA-binding protein [Aeromicrobium sp.]